MFKIYVAYPFTGYSPLSVMTYYKKTTKILRKFGYEVLCPLFYTDIPLTDLPLPSQGLTNSATTTNHAIIEKDHWLIDFSDILYFNFLGTKVASIGSCMELAWGYTKSKHTVVVMEKENIHEHAFVLEAADIVFSTELEAFSYLKKLAKGI